MTADARPSGPASNGDRGSERAEEVAAHYADRLIAGEKIDADEILSAHPTVGPEILEHLEVFVGVGSNGADCPLGTLGDYTLRRQIGRGGMGVVYEAWQNSMDRRVALKVMPRAIAADTRSVTRFIQEAQLAGKLSHPNIVHVHGMGVEQQIPYYAMDFVEGETLAQILGKLKDAGPDTDTPFGKKDQVGYFTALASAFADVADGLQHAHSKGIVHRDIKPSNLILDKDGGLRILDFGLARLKGQESLTISGDVVGTPLYMSPEQARRKKIPVDHRTDVYSLGATLYEMLTLQPPFRGKDHEDTLSQIIERDPVDPRNINQRVPKDLETIVLKCLRKDASDRYGTAEAMGQDLRRFVRGDAVEARPSAKWEKLARRSWRNRRRIVTIACALLFFLAVGSLIQARRSEHQRRVEVLYRSLVLQAIPRLQLGQLNRQAALGTGLAESLLLTGAMTAKDFQRVAGGEQLDPLGIATSQLRKAATILPTRPEAHYHLGRGLLMLGEEGDALQEFDRALQADSSFLPAKILRDALLEKQGRIHPAGRGLRDEIEFSKDTASRTRFLAHRAELERRWPDAAAAYEKLCVLETPSRESYLGSFLETRLARGGACLRTKKYDVAVEDFAAAEAQCPEALEPSLLKGRAYYLKGEQDRAEEVFQAAFERARLPDIAALSVVLIYSFFQNHARAMDWIDKIEDPLLRELHRMSILEDLRQWEKEVEVGNGVLAFCPNEARTYRSLGRAHASLGNLRDADQACRKAIEMDPKLPGAHMNLGLVLLKQSDLSGAMKEYQEEIRLSPRDPTVYWFIGKDLCTHGRIDEAISMCERSLELDPGFAYAYNVRGWAHFLKGDIAAAKADLLIAVDVLPQFIWARRNLAVVLAELGDWQAAKEECLKAMDAVPGFSHAHSLLGWIYHRQGRLDQALLKYCEAIELNPGLHSAPRNLSGLLHLPEKNFSLAPLDHLVEALDNEETRVTRNVPLLIALSLARIYAPTHHDADKSLEYALLALDQCPAKCEKVIPVLNDVLARLQRDKFPDRHRLSILPELPPYAVIDGILEAEPAKEPEYDIKPFESFPSGSQDTPAANRWSYLRGRLLENAGMHREAAEEFSRVVAADLTSPLPLLRRAKSLCEAGDSIQAAGELHGSLATGFHNEGQVWNLWAAVNFMDLKRSPAELLADFPLPTRAMQPRRQESAENACPVYGEGIRWLLERLRAGELVRLQCERGEYRTADGTIWGRDPFAMAANKPPAFLGEMAAVEFHSVREDWFLDENACRAACRMPLPPGMYQLKLDFGDGGTATAGARTFDLLVNGKRIHPEDPSGFAASATADSKRAETTVSVQNGFLDITFVYLSDFPRVTAIEVQAVP